MDRIQKVVPQYSKQFTVSSFDLNEYFDDVIGISIPSDKQIETIKLLFLNGRGNYVITKPIHDSQKKKINEDGSLEITLQVIPNRELVQQILQFGKDVRVLAPTSLVKEIKQQVKGMMGFYL